MVVDEAEVVVVVVDVTVVEVVVSPHGSAVVVLSPPSLYPPHFLSAVADPANTTSFWPQDFHLVQLSSLWLASVLN